MNQTATGEALRTIGKTVAEKQPDEEVYIALITDGQPTISQESFEGWAEGAQTYAIEMAEQLPGNVRLIQFAFAPINPKRTEAFEAYLNDVYQITEASPYGG